MLGGLIPAPDAIASNPIAFKLANMAAYELRSHIEGMLGMWSRRVIRQESQTGVMGITVCEQLHATPCESLAADNSSGGQ